MPLVTVAPLSSLLVQTLDLGEHISDANQRDLVFVAELRQGETLIATQAVPLVPTKHLALRDPAVAATVSAADGGLGIDLQAQSLARLVELAFDGSDTVFSDNYFDLPAGRTIRVSCLLPAGWTVEQARAALKIRSIYDSFAHPTKEGPQ